MSDPQNSTPGAETESAAETIGVEAERWQKAHTDETMERATKLASAWGSQDDLVEALRTAHGRISIVGDQAPTRQQVAAPPDPVKQAALAKLTPAERKALGL